MTSLTPRGRVAVVAAFVVSSLLFAGGAVALVKASDDQATEGTTLPQVHPTLIFPSTSATPTPAPAATASATPTASPTPKASASPTAHVTHSPAPSHSPSSGAPAHLSVSAVLDPASGATTTQTVFTLKAHATDGDGTISFTSLAWGDGSKQTSANGTSCKATPPGDCVNFVFTHTYDKPGTYHLTLVISSGPAKESLTLHLTAVVEST